MKHDLTLMYHFPLSSCTLYDVPFFTTFDSMDTSNIIEIGRIKKSHGKDGKLIIPLDTDIEIEQLDLKFIIVEIHKKHIPYFIEEYSFKNEYLEVKFEDIDSPESARHLVGNYAFIESNDILKDSDKAFSFRELIGYSVSTTDHNEIGTIEDILERSDQPLLKIMCKDEEILIPAVEDFIEHFDRDKKSILLNIPPGLIELNK